MKTKLNELLKTQDKIKELETEVKKLKSTEHQLIKDLNNEKAKLSKIIKEKYTGKSEALLILQKEIEKICDLPIDSKNFSDNIKVIEFIESKSQATGHIKEAMKLIEE